MDVNQVSLTGKSFWNKPKMNLMEMAENVNLWAIEKGFNDIPENSSDYATSVNLQPSQRNAMLLLDSMITPLLKPIADMAENIRHAKGLAANDQLNCQFKTNNITNNNEALIRAKLILVFTEIVEAMNANSYSNFSEELADTFIRLLHICGAMHINITEEIKKKMLINWDRPYRHGKEC